MDAAEQPPLLDAAVLEAPPAPKKTKKVTARQHLFITHFRRHRNASRAARQAGYSPESAADIGYQLLNSPKYRHVQEAVRDALAEDSQKWGHLQELVINHVSRVLTFDPADIQDEAGEMKPLREMDPEDRMMIHEISEVEFRGQDGRPQVSRKVKTCNRNDAAALAAKISGLTKDRLEHSGTLDIAAARGELERALAGLGSRESLESGAGGPPAGADAEAPGEPDGPAVP